MRASLGRGSFVSLAGIEGLLKDLAGQQVEPISRRTLKRAREEDVASHGCILKSLDIVVDGKAQKVQYLDPKAFLQAAVKNSRGFAEMLGQLQTGQSFASPLSWCLYIDEVTPGNALRPRQNRKVFVAYWSCLEWTTRVLQSEEAWFPLMVVLSTVVKAIGGVNVLWKYVMQQVLCEMQAGVVVELPVGARMLFFQMKCFICDEVALKQSLETKGATGTICCPCCQNVLDMKSTLLLHDESGELVSSTCTDYSKFRLHTPESMAAAAGYVARASRHATAAELKRLEQSMGINHHAAGVLLDAELGPLFFGSIMFDWMHILFVTGIVNIQCGLTLGILHGAGWSTERVNVFLNAFRLPQRIQKGGFQDVLTKRNTIAEPVRGSASELLTLVPLLRFYIEKRVLPGADEQLRRQLRPFLLLAALVHTFRSLATRAVDARHLAASVRQYLDEFLAVHGHSDWVPKFHALMHLAPQYLHHGSLLSCFCHERKHKVVKRFTNQLCNWTCGFEKTILQELIASQLKSMKDWTPQSYTKVRLMEPTKKAPVQLERQVSQALGCSGPFVASLEALHGGGYPVHRGDLVVVAAQHGEESIGKADLHRCRPDLDGCLLLAPGCSGCFPRDCWKHRKSSGAYEPHPADGGLLLAGRTSHSCQRHLTVCEARKRYGSLHGAKPAKRSLRSEVVKRQLLQLAHSRIP